jgi:phage FluMu gp28-like protein
MCRDVAEAIKMAGFWPTEERVRHFGSARLIEMFDNMPLEDFQQEYECSWVDESESWITWDEIKKNQESAQAGGLWHRHAKSVDQAMAMIEEVAAAAQTGQIEGVLAGGMDVGRKRDLTELQFVGRATTNQMPVRLSISLSNVAFDDQQAVVTKAVAMLPISTMLIDDTGLGMQIAENLHREHGTRVQGVTFTMANKELWAVELKVQMQRGRVPIPADRELSYQIHSIKKMTTAANNITYDSGRSEGHHADKFWALALAVWAAKNRAMTGQLFY